MREKFKITQSELSRILNVKQNTISQYENGKRLPNILVLKKLSKVFKCSVDDLLDDEELAC